jgi:hypothetical protein
MIGSRAIYTERFRGVTAAGGEVDRPSLFRVFMRDDPMGTFLIDELVIRTLVEARTTALVTGRLKTFRDSVLVDHVYQRANGRWEIVAAQGSAVVR